MLVKRYGDYEEAVPLVEFDDMRCPSEECVNVTQCYEFFGGECVDINGQSS